MPVEGSPRGIPKDPSAGGGGGATIDILDDVGDVSVAAATDGQILTRSGSEWIPGDFGTWGDNLPRTSAIRTSGSLSLNSTTWANVDTGLDLSVSAEAGDTLLVDLSALYGTEAVAAGIDACTLVGGSPVNYISEGAGGASHYGVQAWLGQSSDPGPAGGSVQYVVTTADIEGGLVTLRLRYRTSSAAVKTLIANSNQPLQWHVVNLKGGGPTTRTYQITPDIRFARRGTEVVYDEFDDESIDAAWVEVDKPSSSHRTYTERDSGLLIEHNSTADDPGGEWWHGLVRPLDGLTYPLTIEMAFLMMSPDASYSMFGLVLTDNVTPGSGTQVMPFAFSTASASFYPRYLTVRTFTGWDTQTGSTNLSGYGQSGHFHVMRLVWESANTFTGYFSLDGRVWVDMGSRTPTLTPTHYGIAHTNWLSAAQYQLSVEYVRVYEGDHPQDALDVSTVIPHPPAYKMYTARNFR